MRAEGISIFVIVVLFIGSSNAAQLHVGVGQTYTHPQGAWDASSNGDEIIIHAGTYNPIYSHFVIRSDYLGFTPKKDIWIHSAGDGKAVLHGGISLSGGATPGFGNITVSDLYFDLTFEDASINRYAFWVNCDAGQTLTGCTFRNNVVYNVGSNAANNYTNQFIYIKKDGNHGQHLIEHNTMVNLGAAVDTGYGFRDEVNGWTPASVPIIRSNIIVNCLRGVYSKYQEAGINYAYGDVDDCGEYNFSHPDLIGTGTIQIDPIFYSTNPDDPCFLWLSRSSSVALATGAHDGTHMGALPVADPKCGEWGYLEGDLDENCYVDVRDLARFADQWLNCTDSENLYCN